MHPSLSEYQHALDSLMQLAGFAERGGAVTPERVQAAVDALRTRILEFQFAAPAAGQTARAAALTAPQETTGFIPVPDHTPHLPPVSAGSNSGDAARNVLVASQVGIVALQLKQVLSRAGAEVTIAKDAQAAMRAYKEKDYGLVIVDLFMPTEREGLMVLDEVHAFSVICRIDTQIIILSPPSKDKLMPDRCRQKGARVFLEKNEGWHDAVVEYFKDRMAGTLTH